MTNFPLIYWKFTSFPQLLCILHSKFYFSICECSYVWGCMSLLLNLGFYRNHLGSLKILTTGSLHQIFWFNWTWVWSEHEDLKNHSGGSSVWPRLRTTGPSQIFHSKVTSMPCVLTAYGQMPKIWKRSEVKGGRYEEPTVVTGNVFSALFLIIFFT